MLSYLQLDSVNIASQLVLSSAFFLYNLACRRFNCLAWLLNVFLERLWELKGHLRLILILLYNVFAFDLWFLIDHFNILMLGDSFALFG